MQITHVPPKDVDEVLDNGFLLALNVGKQTVKTLSADTQDHIYVGGFNEIFQRITGDFVNEPIEFDFKNSDLKQNPNLLIASDPSGEKLVILPNGVKMKVKDIIAKNVIPYNSLMKQRLINAAETDQAVQTAMNILGGYVLDEERKALIKPVDHYKTQTETEFSEILNKIIDPEIQKYLAEFISSTDRYSRVWEDYVPINFKRALTLGTSGFFTELVNLEPIINKDLEINVPLGTPAICKDIHPYYFQKVYYNRLTLKPVYLEYSDKNYKLIDDKDILTSNDNLKLNPEATGEDPTVLKTDQQKSDYGYVKEMIGYKQFILKDPNEREDDIKQNRNTNLLLPINQCVLFKHSLAVAPNVEFFGISKVFSILEISEINREIHFDILPSANKLQMRGSGIITAQDIKSKSKLTNLEQQLEAGANYIITSSPITYVPINIPVDMEGISKQRFDNIRHILMGMNLPSPMLNFENVTNRDTLRIVAEFFKDTSLDPLRKMVNIAMRDQWYYRLIEFFFRRVLPNSPIASKADKKNYSFINLKLQIINEFANINFAVFEELIKALNQCLFLTEAEKREIIGRAPLSAKDQRAKDKPNPKEETMQKEMIEVDKISDAVRSGRKDPQEGKKEVSEIRSNSRKTGTTTDDKD